jgi:RNA polymerase sigma-70 factor (ECF subfamily)
MRKNENIKVLGTDFEALFGRYYKPLCAAAYAYLRDKKDSEDIVQQIFLRLLEKSSSYHALSTPSDYLFGAVRNACINHLRRERARTLPLPADIEETAQQAMEVMLDDEGQRVLFSALSILNERNRQAFEMVYFENKTYRETAVALEISVNTVKWHLKTAISSLRKHPSLQEYFLKK